LLIPLLFIRERSPLHLSAENGRLEICRLLLQFFNADLQAKDNG
jgi:ankyrin repeat protein